MGLILIVYFALTVATCSIGGVGRAASPGENDNCATCHLALGIPNLLSIGVQYGISDAVSKVHASGNAGPNAATNYPSILNRWHEFLARLEYSFHKNVGLNLGYYYNGYKTKDYGVDIMKLWMGDVDTGANVQRSIFLGDQLKGSYNAHVGFIGLKLKF